MSEENVINEELENKGIQNQEFERSALDEILEERDNPKKNESKEENDKSSKKELIEDPKNLKSEKVTKPKSDEKIPDKEKAKKISPDDEDDEEVDEHKIEVEKLKKALNDSQKWGHSSNKRLKSVTKLISSFKEEGTLTEEEFEKLSGLLNSDTSVEDPEIAQLSNDPFIKLMQIANTRLSDLEDISDDPLFKKKIAAFDHLIENMSQEERDEIVEELEEFEKNPLKLAKKIMNIGEKYYNEFYDSFDKAGGLKALISTKDSKIESLQKKIDKLEKKLLQYDYDAPTNKIDEIGDTEASGATKHRPGGTLDQLEEEREASYKRKRGY